MNQTKTYDNIDGRNLVFIVGAARSGTTYLQRLLATHPKIKTGVESHLFSLYINPLLKAWKNQVEASITETRSGLGLPCYMDEVEYMNTLKMFLLELMEPMLNQLEEIDEIFLEKSPSHVNSLDAIHQLLPKARIIHIIRDPRDVVASTLAASNTWGKSWAVNSAKIVAYTWCEQVNKVKQFSQGLDSSLLFELHYENLVENPIQSLKNLVDFIDLNWTQEELEDAIYKNSLEVVRKTGGTVIPVGGLVAESRGNVLKEPEGFVRKGKPGSWKMDLTVFDKLMVWLIAKSTMEKVGYSWKFPW